MEKLTVEQKLNECIKIFRIYKPMSDEAEKWHDALPKGIEIDYPFDDMVFMEEIVLSICDVKMDRMEEDVLNYVSVDDYDEEQFIEDVKYLLNI